jgi:hypothetical protein
MTNLTTSAAVAILVFAAPAFADPADADATLHSTVGWGNTIGPQHVSVSTEAGYDGAQQRAQATGLVEVTLIPRLSVFAAVTYGEETTGTSRPALGLAYQIVDPHTSPIGVRLSSAYKPEGFAEPEGEFESILVLSHLVQRDVVRMFTAYGRDADGHESDVELGAGYLHRATAHLVVGATTRYRYALALKTPGPRWDLIGGAVADLAIDRWRVELLLGGGAVGTETTSKGLLSLVSVGIDL